MNANASEKKEFKKEAQPFEFTFYLNDNIIVQRVFNVIGFNSRAINSIDFKDVNDYNQELIQNHLKSKSLDYMDANYLMFLENPNYGQNTPKDKMKLLVKHNGKVISYREWDATIYPPEVRHTVNIREYIYEMITKIQKCLSKKNDRLETTYLSYDLAV